MSMGFADDVIAVRRSLIRLALDRKELRVSRDDLHRRAAAMEKEARRLRNPELIAVTLLHRAELLLADDRISEAASVLVQAKEVLDACEKTTCACEFWVSWRKRMAVSKTGKPFCYLRRGHRSRGAIPVQGVGRLSGKRLPAIAHRSLLLGRPLCL